MTRLSFIPRNLRIYIPILLFLLAIIAALSIPQLRSPQVDSTVEPVVELVALRSEPIVPIPLELELDQKRVALGDRLFHDPALSSNDTISCATCHRIDQGGTDGLAFSQGMLGANTGLNSPTVFNSGFHFRFNWDGRAETLEDQIDGPITAEKEMGGMSWPDVVNKLSQAPEYLSSFNEIYPEGITEANIKDAIAIFQHSLYTPNAPFDQYLRGNDDAISDRAKEGYSLFKSYGCVTCHQGMLVGGNMFQTLGVFGDYFADRGNITKADLGRYNVTQDDLDRYVFKVPSLRNITLTAPYFHDGNPKTLDQAIKLMGKYQLGVDIPQQDVDLIMHFLRSLTGEYQGQPL
ncbi:cytochrome c peroxidase [Xenococcus sp. PCC 7305]|uniref:cytochrome-c peroxidase n=1 Tax=Xenococcus sp. PCC 7305 TaxID=102125 RepID=UPI0002ACBAF3|nr:cytochrome-c peroxidase [Xenococcus sp. PCC 7305]ELS00892.1 cytochrome c peroxidase [Xenococcus sp. PCC 7305]